MRADFVKYFRKIISGNTILYTLLTVASAVCNFLCLMALGRVYGAIEYGVVSTLIALYSNLRVLMFPVLT